MEVISYKGYTGSIEYSDMDKRYYGKVLYISSLISYEGNNLVELKKDFYEAIDDYLQSCNEEGVLPETPKI